MLRITQVSNHGTSAPAVARTLLQGCDLLEFFEVGEDRVEAAKAVLLEMQRHLLRCVEVHDSVASDVGAGLQKVRGEGLDLQGRVVVLPPVPDLHSRAETFLQSAKLAIRQTGALINPFYGTSFGHNYRDIQKWAAAEFGEEDLLARVAEHSEPWVKRVVGWRHLIEHPKDVPGGRLVTRAFDVRPAARGVELLEPAWGPLGEPLQPIVPEMAGVIEDSLQLGEEVLVALFERLKGRMPLVVREIPVERRDPSCPKRLRVDLSQELRDRMSRESAPPGGS